MKTINQKRQTFIPQVGIGLAAQPRMLIQTLRATRPMTTA